MMLTVDHPQPEAFVAAALPFLLEEEAVNCLLVGILWGMRENPDALQDRYRAVVRDGEAVRALALRTSLRLVLSHATVGDDLSGSTAEGIVDRHLARGTLFVWEDGRPVSMAAAPGETPNGATVNLVYTPPALRRRGYAGACVAATSRRLLESGKRWCFLYTDLANLTTNHIYQQIGYRPVCDVILYHL